MQALGTGRFARLCGLSVKALRLYDVSGLLRPAAVDEANGYRRYSPEQVERARRIKLLRTMGMPLALIGEVLQGSDEEAAVRLDRWWAAQEASAQSRRGSYRWLRAQLAHAAEPERRYAISVRDVPATKVATVRTRTDQIELIATVRECDWLIRRDLAAQGATTGPAFWVSFFGPVTPDTEAVVEVAVPYTGTIEPTGAIVIRLEGAHREAYTTVTRDDCFYPRIVGAHEAVARHAGSTGPTREIYLDYWERVAGDDPFAEVTACMAEEL